METKDVFTVFGLIVSLLFNILNFRRTSQLRADTLRLDEFKRLRCSVDVAYSEIKSARATLRSLEASGSTAAKLRKDVSECNKALTATYDALCDALSDLIIAHW